VKEDSDYLRKKKSIELQSKDFERNKKNVLSTRMPLPKKSATLARTMSPPSTKSIVKSRGEDLQERYASMPHNSFPGATKREKLKSAPRTDVCELFHRSFDETSLSLSDIALSMELDP
jgi:hypothetical protein